MNDCHRRRQCFEARGPKVLLGAFLGLIGSLGLMAAAAADWTGFRGPKSLGVSAEHGLPVTWTGTENVVWKTRLPGPGSSSPITSGSRIFLTCCTGYGTGQKQDNPESLRRLLLALDRQNGKILWQQEVPAKLPETPYQGNMTNHSYASSTPVTDGQRVFVFFGKSGVGAYDLDGKPLWQADAGSGTHQWNSASSPVLYKDLVIVNAAVESNALLAFDKQHGKQVWKTPGIKGAWGTPVLVEVPGGQQELVLSIPRTILGLDPDTGKELWRCEGIADGYLCPSVVAKDGIVYVVGGRGGIGAIAVKAGGRGDVTATQRLWTQKVGSRVPSPVLHEGHLYWVNDQGGMANCLKADTGEIVYQQRLPGAGLTYASAVAADGKLYVVTRQGGTYVLAAQPKFTQLAHNQIEDDRSIFNASPAVDRGQLLVRSDQYLYCIGAK